MQRPVMNPNFAFEAPAPTKPRRKPFGWVWRGVRWLWRFLLASPFGHRGVFRNEEGTKFSRFVRGLTYRLAFVPVLLVMFLVAIVLAATHPGRSQHGPDPLAYGVYYDPVNFLADDGTHLDGWLVPVLDAKRVLYVHGGGDPFLISEELAVLAEALVAAIGKKPVTGIVLDASYYPTDLRIPGVEDSNRSFDALNSALAVNFNTINAVRRGNKVESAEKQTPITELAINQFQARGPNGRGRISLNQEPALSLQYAGELLAAFITKAGGGVTGKITTRFVPALPRPSACPPGRAVGAGAPPRGPRGGTRSPAGGRRGGRRRGWPPRRPRRRRRPRCS